MKRYQKNQCRHEPVCSRVSDWLRAGIILIFVVGACMAWQFSVGSLRGYSQPTEAVPPVTSSSLLQAGDEAFRRGAFEQAADAWQHSAQLAHEAGNLREECDAHVAVAQSYVVLGFHTRAAQQLELAVAIAQLVGDLSRQAVALNLLGQTYLTAGRPEPALETLENAQRLAAEAHDQVRMATILHSLGTTQAAL
ncbi:MAG TPA: tetratricopeptide repeat protein, partial [Nitrospiraceae bacterium]|nr:tetratricopeptide repeat protein [Nitrospiraceae bacterium]